MGLLEVIVLYAADAQRVEEGGADRAELLDTMDEDGLSPGPVMVAEVRRATSIRICPIVWLRVGFRTDGGGLVRLRGLTAPYLDKGTSGVVLEFLGGHADIDLEVCNALVADSDFTWTFHRTVDNCLDLDDAREDLAALPRLNQVLTANSARGVKHGLDELLKRARSNPGIVQVIMAGGGLWPKHIPRLIRAGVRAFRIDSPTRPGDSYKAYTDPDLVRTWQGLIDEQTVAVGRSR